MLSTLRLTGTVASRGFAEGPLVPLAVVHVRSREADDAHKELGTLRAAIERALLAIEKLDTVKVALDVFWGAVFGLGPTRHENYRTIEESMDSLGIPESDVLGE